MPIFEYQCQSCKKEFEKLVFSGEEEGIQCPDCRSREIRKKMSATSFMGPSIGTCASPSSRGFS